MPKPQPLDPALQPGPTDEMAVTLQKLNVLMYMDTQSTDPTLAADSADPMALSLQKINQLSYNRVAGGVQAGGGINYSLSEQDTGILWIDGKKVYQKTVQFTSIPKGETFISHGISNINNVIEIQGAAFDGTNYFRIPHTDPMYPTYTVGCYANATQTALRAGEDLSAYTWVYLTMWYTCTDR